ncbi:hypothetical protein HOE04_04925 [archaeon]|jgi:hypothetical protein|nr:hypothetical protein [archaeon]
MIKRELKLVQDGSPCGVDYFDRDLLTVQQALEKGQSICSNYSRCDGDDYMCTMRMGLQVAGYAMQKGDLKKELYDFYEQASREGWLNKAFWDSVNRREFKKIKGKGNILRAVEGFAKVVLLEDPFESVLSSCEKCEGIKLEKVVRNSVWVRGMRCAGTGEVVSKEIAYCPDCNNEPKNGIVYEDELGDR